MGLNPFEPPQQFSWPALYDPSTDLNHLAGNDPLQPGGHYLTDANDIFRFTFYWTLVFYVPPFVVCGLVAFANLVFGPASRHLGYTQIHPVPIPVTHDADDDDHWECSPPKPGQEKEAYRLSSVTAGRTSTATALSRSVASPFALASKLDAGSALHPSRPVSAAAATIMAAQSRAQPPAYAHADVIPPRRTLPKTRRKRTRAAYALLVLLIYLASGLGGAVVGSLVLGYILAGLFKSGDFYMSTWIPLIFAAIQSLIGILSYVSKVVISIPRTRP